MFASDVVTLSAPDISGLTRALEAARADDLIAQRSAGSNGGGGAALAIAASDVAGVERAISLARKVGLERAAEELRAKQGLFVRVGPIAAPEKTAFMFSGQGSQYGGMMRALADEFPAARAIVERADRWLGARGVDPISAVMFSGAPIPRDVFTIQASVLCADVMALEALSSAGYRPAIVTGHSYGDYAALVAAEVWSLEDALFATRVRSEAITASTIPGGMTSIAAGREDVDRICREARAAGQIQVANVNGPDQIVVAGTIEALERAERLCAGAGIETVRLDVPRAFHSVLMEGARARLQEGLARVPLARPRVDYLSSITGAVETEPENIRRALVEQLVRPVEFVAQVGALIARGANVFVECGPKGVLAGLVKRILARELAAGEDLAIATSDDAQRPGRFAIARVAAMIAARRAVAGAVAGGGGAESIAVLSGERARVLLAEPGFAEFWKESRGEVLDLVRRLWDSERGASTPPIAATANEAPAASSLGATATATATAIPTATATATPSPAALSVEPVPAVVESVDAWSAEGAGLSGGTDQMTRFAIRVIEADRPPPVRRFAPPIALILGDSPRAHAVAASLAARGSTVYLEPDATRALDRLTALGGPAAVPTIGVVLPPASAPAWSIDQVSRQTCRAQAIEDPFRLLRAWAPARSALPEPGGTAFAITSLGGALGFENAIESTGEHGALFGLFRAIRRELNALQLLVLDTSPTDSDATITAALLDELDAGIPRLDVGCLRKKRFLTAMIERPADHSRARSTQLPRAWLITGGARGVTARIAERLAALYRPALHLFGRQPLPTGEELERLRSFGEPEKRALMEELRARSPKDAAIQWRARVEAVEKILEIDRNLQKLRALGSPTKYYAIDVADPAALARALAEIRAESAPLEGLIHGAGVELAKPFDKKSDELLRETIAGKVDGLLNILQLTAADPLQKIITFSSVSGRFGGHGQTDYSLANEAMARIAGEWRAKTQKRATTFSWPAFGEVGLAMRSSSKLFLEKAGQSFMPPAEGADHLIRELWADLPESEVTICEPSLALDADGLLPASEEERRRRRALEEAARRAPLLDHLSAATPSSAIFERTVYASEPFLDQHRMGATPILPAVIALELFAETAAIARGDTALEEVEIHHPLKLAEGSSRELFVRIEADRLQLTSSVLRTGGVILEPQKKFVTARSSRAAFSTELARAIADRAGPAVAGEPIAYPYLESFDPTPKARTIFHGPVFRVVAGVQPTPGGGVARLIVPSASALHDRAGRLRLPANLIDGCLQAAGMLGRLLYSRTGLPRGFGRVLAIPDPHLRPGTEVTLHVAFRDGESLISDLAVFGPDGPILVIEAYRASALD